MCANFEKPSSARIDAFPFKRVRHAEHRVDVLDVVGALLERQHVSLQTSEMLLGVREEEAHQRRAVDIHRSPGGTSEAAPRKLEICREA